MVNITFSGNRLTINTYELSVEYDIKDVRIVDGTIVVLFQVPPDDPETRNVAAFDTNGDRQWTIEAPQDDGAEKSYHYIQYEKGKLTAHNWDGYQYIVDIQTGSASRRKRFGQRLQIGNETIRHPRELEQVLVVKETVVVLFKIRNVREDQNVVAFNTDGSRRWTIESPVESDVGRQFTGISYEDDQLVASNWDNYRYTVDITTGEIIAANQAGKSTIKTHPDFR